MRAGYRGCLSRDCISPLQLTLHCNILVVWMQPLNWHWTWMWSPRWPENPVHGHRKEQEDEDVVLDDRLLDMEELELDRVQEHRLLGNLLVGVIKERV